MSHVVQGAQIAILFPMFVLAGWTACVLLMIPFARVRAVRQGQAKPGDFKYGESASVPPSVSLPNRNYMNLLELPMLFYVVCLLIFVTGGTSASTVAVAWAFVALRLVHSAIHLTYNHVLHRLAAFALSNVTLIVLWVLAALPLMAPAGA